MSIAAANSANVLAESAFGDSPAVWPLPPAQTPHQQWLRAVAAGGQGRYACALADLELLRRQREPGVLVSLAATTRASFWRQLGWHDRARTWDGRALAAAATGEAGADAMIGLAADALGVGRFAASARALALAERTLADTAAPTRVRVRLAWVSAELAMFRGDGRGSVQHAETAVAHAAEAGSTRHDVKSRIVLAAALCSAGDLAASRREAESALGPARRHGLVPLQWAITSLLADIGADGLSAAQIVDLRDTSAETITRWGGVWRPR